MEQVKKEKEKNLKNKDDDSLLDIFPGLNANDNDNVNINDNEDINKTNIDVGPDNSNTTLKNKVNEKINELLEEKKPKNPGAETLKKMKGIYFDKEVLEVLENLSNKRPRGFKSKFVNAAVQKELIEQGLWPIKKK